MTVEQLAKNEEEEFVSRRTGRVVDPIEIGDIVKVTIKESDLIVVSDYDLHPENGFLDYVKPKWADSYFVVERKDADDGTKRIRCKIQYCRSYSKERYLRATQST
jgi:hypothetical protein